MNEATLGASFASVRARPSDADLLATLRKRADLTDEDIEMAPPFFFDVVASNTRLDAYFTQMSKKTLKNFAAAAGSEEGVSFQNSHNWMELGFGRTIRGEFVPGDPVDEKNPPRMEATVYTVPGLTLGRVSTDDLIRGIRTRLIRDVSVGFHGGTYTCNLCKRELWSGDCRHVPGLSYDGKGKDDGRVVATAEIDDAHLSEISAVYDGATPGAAIVKARQLADAGHLLPEQARLLETRYRGLTLPVRHVWAGHHAETGDAMDPLTKPAAPPNDQPPAKPADLTRAATPDPMREAIRAAFAAANRALDDTADPVEAVRAVLTERQQAQAEVVSLNKRVAELTPLADEGRAYRVDLIDAALAEGVRALGDKFSLETYRAILEGAPISTVKQMTADWTTVAQQQFAGGRKTTESYEPYETKPKAAPPDAAFAG